MYTNAVNSLQFAKAADTYKNIQCIIKEAAEYLSKDTQCVIISIVIPDSFYKGSGHNIKIHQAHTFALSVNKNLLTVYDINFDTLYKGREKYLDNYKLVIDSLTKDRELRFFSLTYARQNNFKSTMHNADNECVCFIYIKELEEKNAIR